MPDDFGGLDAGPFLIFLFRWGQIPIQIDRIGFGLDSDAGFVEFGGLGREIDPALVKGYLPTPELQALGATVQVGAEGNALKGLGIGGSDGEGPPQTFEKLAG